MTLKNKATKITKSITLLLMAVLLFSSLDFVHFAFAEGDSFTTTIQAPLKGETFSTNNVTVKFMISYAAHNYLESLNVNCYLDGQLCAQMQLNETVEGITGDSKKNYTDGTPSSASGEFVLKNLTPGEHKMRITGIGKLSYKFYAISWSEDVDSGVLSFFVNPPISSLVMVLSGVIAGAVIVSIALLIIYRKQNLKRKDKPNIS